MSVDLEQFKPAYEKWVEEGMPDFLAGNMSKILKKYPSIIPDDIPWTTYTGKPSEQTFALVTSAGLYLRDRQPAFETAFIHGDPSLREIPKTVQQAEIGIAHAHYDHSLAKQDINIIFPIHRLIELENEGIVGKVADTHYSTDHDRTGRDPQAALPVEAPGSGLKCQTSHEPSALFSKKKV